MNTRLDLKNGVPVYQQLVDQIRGVMAAEPMTLCERMMGGFTA
jgi:DNA-binding transcriptional regulator YhcF (GntR family)